MRTADFVLGKPFGGAFSFLELEIGNLLTNGCFFGVGIMMWSLTSRGYSKLSMITATICIVSGVIATASSARYKYIDQGGPERDMLIVPLIWLSSIGCIAACAYWNRKLCVLFSYFSRPLRTIGLATYPLYLVHQISGRAIMEMASTYVGAKLSFIIALSSALAIAWAIVYLERYPKIIISRLLSVSLQKVVPLRLLKPERRL